MRLWPPLDDHIEWIEPTEFPGGGTYHGREGARRYLGQSRATLAEGTSEPVQFIPDGNRIVVFVHAHVRPQGSPEWHDIDLSDVYTVREGRIVQMLAFPNRQEALRWAGAKSVSPAASSKWQEAPSSRAVCCLSQRAGRESRSAGQD
jgi:ketosteroid isomerase-like protein